MPGFFDDTQMAGRAQSGGFFDDTQDPSKAPGDFMRGAKVALGQTVPILKGVVGLAGATAENAFGAGGMSTAVKDWGLSGYNEGMQKLQPLQRDTDELTTAWDRAKQGDLGALLDWAQYGLGYAVGQGGEALLMSAVGGAIGAAAGGGIASAATGAGGAVTGLVAKGAVKEVASKLIEKAATKQANAIMAAAAKQGANVTADEAVAQATRMIARNIASTSTMLAYGGAQELGSIYPEAEAQAQKEGRQLNGGDLARIWASGIVAGGIEGLTDKLGVDAALGKLKPFASGGRIGNAAKMGLGGMVVEGATEATQTAIERFGAGQEVTSGEGVRDMINSAALGALGGAAIGGGVGLIHGKPAEQVRAEADQAFKDISTAPTVDDALKAFDAAHVPLQAPPAEFDAEGAMARMEANSQADYKAAKVAGRQPGYGDVPFVKIEPKKASAEAIPAEPEPFLDRLLTIRELIGDSRVRQEVRDQLGPDALSDVMYYAQKADDPSLPGRTSDRLLQLAEGILDRAKVKPIPGAPQAGSANSAQRAELGGPTAPLAIPLDTTPTGAMRVDAAGQAVPEIRADQISMADRARAMAERSAAERAARDGMTASVPRGGEPGAGVMVGEGTLTTPARPGAAPAETRLLPGPQEMVKVYRGEGKVKREAPEWVRQKMQDSGQADAEGRWWTTDPKVAQWYADDATDGHVVVQEVPRSVVEASRVESIQGGARKFSRAPEEELFLPPEYKGRGTPIDALAHAAAPSPENDLPEPTPAQIEAGNYKKGHVRIAGLDISVENPQGSTRSGVDADGKPWSNTLQHHYGYIKGTIGQDGEHIDTFVKPGAEPTPESTVFVIDQIDPKTGKPDEHKVMLGFETIDEAKDAYKANYHAGWNGMKTISATPMAEFKQWLATGDTTKPFHVERAPATPQVPNEPGTKYALPSFVTAGAARAPAAPTTFKTSKGSTYRINGQSTTRDKAARSDVGHEGDSGPQKPSERTFYVDAAGLSALGEFQAQGAGKKRIVTGPSRAAMQYLEGPSAGKMERRTDTAIFHAPAVGLYPVEMWNDGAVVHFGNQITEVGSAPTLKQRAAAASAATTAPTTEDDAARWTRMPAAERAALVRRAGWKQVDGKPTLGAQKVARTAWADLTKSQQSRLAQAASATAAPAAAETAPAAPTKMTFAEMAKAAKDSVPSMVGRNAAGEVVYTDARGVRSILRDGVRTYEKVGLVPTRDGMRVSPNFKHSGEFVTADEDRLADAQRRYDVADDQGKQIIKPALDQLKKDTTTAAGSSSTAPNAGTGEKPGPGKPETPQQGRLQAARDSSPVVLFGRELAAAGMEFDGNNPRDWSENVGERGEIHAEMLDSPNQPTRYSVRSTQDGKDFASLTTAKLADVADAVREQRAELLASERRGDGANEGAPQSPREAAPAAAPAPTVNASTADTEAMRQAKADAFKALGDIADIFGRGTKLNMMEPEQEAKLLPALTRLMDAAFRMGYLSFKQAARFALDQIRTALGPEVENEITIDHLQGAYIGMAGRYRDKGAEKPAAVAAVQTKDELSEASDATPAVDQQGPGALAGVPTPAVRAPEGAGDAGNGAAGRGAGDRGRDEPAVDRRGEPVRSAEPGRADAPVPAARAGRRRAAGTERGVSERAPVPEGDAGIQRPVAPPEFARKDFRITDDVRLGEGGQKTKFKQNLAAIRLLNDIEATGRMPTVDEQNTLARYVGWGGLPQAFDANKDDWAKEYAELKAALTPEEYATALESTQYAHYTSEQIIGGMYDALQRLGVTGGKFLEPGAGVGNFVGLMPNALKTGTRTTMVERERIAAGIAKALYPEQNVQRADFTEFKGADDYFDAVIGNPPFAATKLTDASGRKHLSGLSVHNYFFAKAIDMLRPGGVLAQVVSNSFLDAGRDTARRYIGERAKLLGAIRLPNSAFSKNAGTEVTTDIVFLQKLPESEWGTKAAKEDAARWADQVMVNDPGRGEPIPINRYFAEHPEMMLGRMERAGTMYRADMPALIARPGQDTAALLKAAIARLPENVYTDRAAKNTAAMVDGAVQSMADMDVEVGGFFQRGGKLYERVSDDAGETRARELTPETQWTAKTTLGEKRHAQLRELSDLRTTLRSLLASEMAGENSKAMRAELNRQYDAYVKGFGLINDASTISTYGEDPDFPLLASLEHDYKRGLGAAAAKTAGVKPFSSSAVKSPIFTRPVIDQTKRKVTANTPRDALVVSIAERGRIDPAFMSGLLNRDAGEVLSELASGAEPALFVDPASQEYVLRDAYLSGNVRKKLEQARQAGMTGNVRALQAVQPEPIPAHEISVRLGAPWVPTEVYEDFAKTLLGDGTRARIGYLPLTSGFMVNIQAGSNVAETSTHGTPKMGASEILNALLNNKTIKITYTQQGKTYTDQEGTEAANLKATEMREKFADWAFKDSERAEVMAKHYNDENNNYVTRKFDGAPLSFPGKVPDSIISLRRKQKDGIARIVQDRTALLDHVVGAGKTFTVVAGAMELKRTGLANKPMVAVPNHLVKQWAADWYRLYPGANILAATKKDFEKANRRKFLARIATGDWDAVIVAHSSFGFIAPSAEFEQQFNEKQIQQIMQTQQLVESEEGETSQGKRRVKQLAKMKEGLEQRIKGLRDKPMDSLLDFGQLGVDQLFVDEAHMFKNLMFTTKMQNVAGLGDGAGSQRAYDMYVKTQQVMAANGRDQGVVFATGTPVSNSLAEMYHMMRYLMPTAMEEAGFQSFDAWANTFASVEQVWLQKLSGDGFKAQNRMSTFVNTPELLKMFDQVADTVTMQDIKTAYSEDNGGAEFPLPKLKTGRRQPVSIKKSAGQTAYMETLAARAKALELRRGPPKKGDDNALVLMTDARKAAMDIRLVDPTVLEREPGGRIDKSADETMARYRQFDAMKGTQVVFSDLGTPLKHAKKDLSEYNELKAEADRLDDGNLLARAQLGDKDAAAALEKAQVAADALEAKGQDWLDAIQAALRGFSVYDDFKAALIERGVPESEIAFIHDYNTDEQKAGLYRAMNAGRIRVLMGSTPKLGAGTNIQQRLVAEHHLDVPWKPSDVEQREGRIVRQGNLFATPPTKDAPNPFYIPGFEVEILAYVTQDTLDMRMWQIQEAKLKMINQLRERKVGREVDNAFQDMEMSAGEMQAAATGNIDLLTEIQLKNDVKLLEQRQRAFDAQRSDIQSRTRAAQRTLESAPAKRAELKPWVDAAKAYREAMQEERAIDVTVNNKRFTNRSEAAALLRELVDAHEKALVERQERIAADDALKPQDVPMPKMAVEFNGKVYGSVQTLSDAFVKVAGDGDRIDWKIGDRELISRAAIRNAIMQDVAEALATDTERDVGGFGPFTVKVEGVTNRVRGKSFDVAVTLNGKTRSNYISVPDSKTPDAAVGPTASRVAEVAQRIAFNAEHDLMYLESDEARARKTLKDIAANAGPEGEFPGAADLARAREKHKAIIAKLKAVTPAAPAEPDSLRSAFNPDRRAALLAAAAMAASPAGAAPLNVGRAAPIDQAVLDQKVSPAVEKMLRGNGATNIQGATVLRDVMADIAKNGPAPLRALAKQIGELMPERGVFLAVDDTSKPNAHGVVDLRPMVRLRLFTAEGRTGLSYDTLLHESLHVVVAARYRTLGTGLLRSNDALLKSSAPAASAQMAQFRAVWDEFREFAGQQKISDQATATSVEESIGSPDEFFVRALTDANLQRFMAAHEYKGKTLWERFKDWVKTSLFGFSRSGTAPSWLDAALIASKELAEGMNNDPADFKRLNASDSLRDRPQRERMSSVLSGMSAVAEQAMKNGMRGFDQKAARNAFADALTGDGATNFWGRTVGTQYHKARTNPTTFGRVFDAVQDYIKDISIFANAASDQAPSILPKLESWTDLKRGGLLSHGAAQADMKAAGAALFQGTLTDKKVYSAAELRSMGLNDKQAGLYREARAAIETSLDDLAKSEMVSMAGKDGAPARHAVMGAADANEAAQILGDFLAEAIADPATTPVERARMADTAQQVRDKAEQIQKLKDEGYAPLMRFGRHTLHVVDKAGETLYFSMHESSAEANIAKRELQQDPQFAGAEFKRGLMSEQAFKLFQGVPLDALELFATTTGNADNPVYQEYLKVAKSNRSALKRMIKRQGIAGFSEDTTRVLASFITSNARMSSANLNLGAAKKAAEAIPKELGDLKDDAIKLIDYVQNPQEEAAAMRGLLFINFIGGSIASAAVNLTQTFTMTLPYLTQWGAGAAARHWGAALGTVASGKASGDVAAALKRAEDDGIVSPQEIHDLQAAAMKGGVGITGALKKKAAFIWGSLFSLSEQFNRRVTFVAAFNLAKQQGMENPFEFAERAVIETQGLYNKGNKANWARGPIGATVMTFKQFSTHYLEFLTRMYQSGPEGKKAVLVALAILMLTGGAGGLPFAEDLDDMIDTLAQALGYDFSSKKAKRKFIAETLGAGDTAAELVTRGLSAIPGMPIDVSLRMGMGNLLPGTGALLRSNTDRSRDVLEFAGAAGGMAKNALDAGTRLLSGDVAAAGMTMAPVAIQNMAKAAGMWNTGEYRDTKGRKVMDTDALDGAMKFIGFQPAAIARESTRIGEGQRSIQLVKNVEGEIASKWAQGLNDKDTEKVTEARQELADWNRRNPESQMRITMQQVIQRVRQLQSTRAERTIKAAPAEMRQAAREALQ